MHSCPYDKDGRAFVRYYYNQLMKYMPIELSDAMSMSES